MNLFEILKSIERLGYKILTYDEAEDILNIKPLEISNYYFNYFSGYKKYFVFNNYINTKELSNYILLF